jgi:OTU domain-containing protein 6
MTPSRSEGLTLKSAPEANMEELQSKHRKEQKDLQGRITQKKKNATKKTRKGVNDECESLQRELQNRQQAEIEMLNGHLENDTDLLHIENEQEREVSDFHQPHGTTNRTSAESTSSHEMSSLPQQPSKRPNRQKARLARRAAEQEAQAAQAAEEAAELPDLRKQEIAAMQQHSEKLGFKEISIRPDGHCMYSAVAMLLQDSTTDERKFDSGGLPPYQTVRAETASFISKHPTDFEAFLEEPIDQYTSKIKDTTEWGGQLELQAIARAYGVNINVLQADGRIEKIVSGGDAENGSIWLTYYRHSFGLGEHYNALKKAA